jgi:hypothetical protein
MSNILQAIGTDNYEAIRGLVQRSFPEPRCTVGNDLVDRFIAGLPPEARLVACGIELGEDLLASVFQAQGETIASEIVTYYVAQARHSRVSGPAQHSFVEELQFVHVKLPEEDARDLTTAVGVVFAGDHKLYTARQFREKYKTLVPFQIKSVELVTPARYFGARFAAVAAFALIDEAGLCRAYVLEAGMATGEAMMTFLAPELEKPIVRPSYYVPTPFASETHWYRGVAIWSPRSTGTTRLHSLEIDVLPAASAPAHTQIRASFIEAQTLDPAFPSAITARAGLRVAAIADAMGKADPLMKLLAPFGRALPWLRSPA